MTETIIVDMRGRVGLITLNRPQALNALDRTMMRELTEATASFDRDPEVAAVVVTGSAKAFAAGADISQMQANSFSDMYLDDWFAGWDSLTRVRKPLIAAVSGYALLGESVSWP